MFTRSIKFFVGSVFLFAFAFLSNGFAMSGGAGRLDSFTRECLKCHKMDQGKHFGPGHTSHIVGVDYITVSIRDPTLVAAALLDPKIVLIKGRISCITCHISYVRETHRVSPGDRESAEAKNYPMLRVDNSGSGLCLKCHKK